MIDDLTLRIQRASLTRGQRIIADYISKHKNRITSMTSLMLAREIGVSDASIIRFARAIGYEGFSDMKADFYHQLTQEISQSDVGGYSVDQRLNLLTEKYQDLDLSKEFPKLLMDNVEHSIRQNPYQKYDKIVDALYHGRKKFVLGLRGGQGAASYFGRLLGYLMDEVTVITSGEGDTIAQMQSLQRGDVVVAISYARYYKIDMLLARLIEKQGAMLCTLTDSMNSPLARNAAVVLLVETKHIAFSNSVVGTVGALEYLLTILCWKYPKKYQERLAERERLLDTFRLKE
jgi:DNA-binding MurR/RpiR family transcriptional regulator